jgi:hypothetical protein
MASGVTYQTRTDEQADLWVPAPAAAEPAPVEFDQAAWEPDETGDAIDFLASIDSHNLGHDDAWEL